MCVREGEPRLEKKPNDLALLKSAPTGKTKAEKVNQF